jgi:excisionase family DNA binding protein
MMCVMNARFSSKSGRTGADIRITQPNCVLGSIPAWALLSPRSEQNISASQLALKAHGTPRSDWGSDAQGSTNPNTEGLGSGVYSHRNDPAADGVSPRKSHGKLRHVGNPVERLLTIGEAADILAISTKTLRRLINRGDLQTVRIGRSVRITREALADLVQRRRS